MRLADLWPDPEEIEAALRDLADPETYREAYRDADTVNPLWNAPARGRRRGVRVGRSLHLYPRAPVLRGVPVRAPPGRRTSSAPACLGLFGDFITTDHISPAGRDPAGQPGGATTCASTGVQPADFNSFGSRRGNHEVMMRGTFGNIRIRNLLADREGGWTVHLPGGEPMTHLRRGASGTGPRASPLVVVAGKMYGAGSSRDWAAKGTSLLGVRAVIAESFERIHRSNLVGMGVLPLEFVGGQTADGLGLTGREGFTVRGLAAGLAPRSRVEVTAERGDGETVRFEALARVDTPVEAEYLRHGGILPYVLRGFTGGGA